MWTSCAFNEHQELLHDYHLEDLEHFINEETSQFARIKMNPGWSNILGVITSRIKEIEASNKWTVNLSSLERRRQAGNYYSYHYCFTIYSVHAWKYLWWLEGLLINSWLYLWWLGVFSFTYLWQLEGSMIRLDPFESSEVDYDNL